MRTPLFVPRLRHAAVALGLAVVAGISGCGGGGGGDVVVVVPPPPPPIVGLHIALTRVGPEAVQVDWSDDPEAESFVVRRDGHTLAQVDAITLVDASVQYDGHYCYDVTGFDHAGNVVSASDIACITIFP